MPALPTYLSEGMSEVDYRGKCDKLKPSVDKALSAYPLPFHAHVSVSRSSSFAESSNSCVPPCTLMWCKPLLLGGPAVDGDRLLPWLALTGVFGAGTVHGLITSKDVALNAKVRVSWAALHSWAASCRVVAAMAQDHSVFVHE